MTVENVTENVTGLAPELRGAKNGQGATPVASAGVVGGPACAPTPGAKSSPASVLSLTDISRRHLPSAVRSGG